MKYLNKFHILIGESLMYCNFIEDEIKSMYANTIGGNYDKNIKKINTKTLTYVLNKLKELEVTNYLINEKNIKNLNEIKNIRNYLVNDTYKKFICNNDRYKYYLNLQEFRKITCYHKTISNLVQLIESNNNKKKFIE